MQLLTQLEILTINQKYKAHLGTELGTHLSIYILAIKSETRT
jgi:hypothetical protein